MLSSPCLTFSSAREQEIERMEEEIRKLTRRARGEDSDEERRAKKKPKKSYLEEEMAKYAKSRGVHKKSKDGKKKDEGDVLAALNSFRSKLKGIELEPAPVHAIVVRTMLTMISIRPMSPEHGPLQWTKRISDTVYQQIPRRPFIDRAIATKQSI